MPTPNTPVHTKDESERAEGRETEALADTGNRDTEPEGDIIPHMAKGLADAHDSAYERMKVLARHIKANAGHMRIKMLRKDYDQQNTLVKSYQKAFAEDHPDLEPLEKDLDSEELLPEGNDPTSEPRADRTERQEEEGGAEKNLNGRLKKKCKDMDGGAGGEGEHLPPEDEMTGEQKSYVKEAHSHFTKGMECLGKAMGCKAEEEQSAATAAPGDEMEPEEKALVLKYLEKMDAKFENRLKSTEALVAKASGT